MQPHGLTHFTVLRTDMSALRGQLWIREMLKLIKKSLYMVQSKSQNNLIILKSTSAWTNSRMKEFIKKKMSLSAFHFSTCIHLWKISLQYDVTCCTLTCQFKLNPLHNTKKPKKKKKKRYFFLFYYEIVLQCTLHFLSWLSDDVFWSVMLRLNLIKREGEKCFRAATRCEIIIHPDRWSLPGLKSGFS